MKASEAFPVRIWAVSFLLLLTGALCLGLSGCAPEDMPESSPQGSGSAEPNTENRINPSQLPDSSFIYDASIIDLQNADSYMEGQTVQVTGEVIGDRIEDDLRPDYCWITLQANDGTYAEVAVYLPKSLSAVIDTYGAYGKRGTTLQVRGTFSMACTDHDGVTGIHADHASLVSRGAVSMPEFSIGRFLPGLILVIIGAALTIWYRYLSERRR